MSTEKSTEKSTEVTLERALERLEEIARQLEGGGLELAESLALYEEGVRLLRRAEEVLGHAETRIHQLQGEGEAARVVPLDEQP